MISLEICFIEHKCLFGNFDHLLVQYLDVLINDNNNGTINHIVEISLEGYGTELVSINLCDHIP